MGPEATLLEESTPVVRSLQDVMLLSPAASIAGGTDQVQRNIIGERALGLPKDLGPDRSVPFRDLPQNS